MYINIIHAFLCSIKKIAEQFSATCNYCYYYSIGVDPLSPS